MNKSKITTYFSVILIGAFMLAGCQGRNRSQSLSEQRAANLARAEADKKAAEKKAADEKELNAKPKENSVGINGPTSPEAQGSNVLGQVVARAGKGSEGLGLSSEDSEELAATLLSDAAAAAAAIDSGANPKDTLAEEGEVEHVQGSGRDQGQGQGLVANATSAQTKIEPATSTNAGNDHGMIAAETNQPEVRSNQCRIDNFKHNEACLASPNAWQFQIFQMLRLIPADDSKKQEHQALIEKALKDSLTEEESSTVVAKLFFAVLFNTDQKIAQVFFGLRELRADFFSAKTSLSLLGEGSAEKKTRRNLLNMFSSNKAEDENLHPDFPFNHLLKRIEVAMEKDGDKITGNLSFLIIPQGIMMKDGVPMMLLRSSVEDFATNMVATNLSLTRALEQQEPEDTVFGIRTGIEIPGLFGLNYIEDVEALRPVQRSSAIRINRFIKTVSTTLDHDPAELGATTGDRGSPGENPKISKSASQKIRKESESLRNFLVPTTGMKKFKFNEDLYLKK